jgi:hypothetical protein
MELVTQACKPSYLGGRDQEDVVWSQPQENSLQDPILKIPNTKKGWPSSSKSRAPA